jgi:hypothetical protein
MTEYWSTKMLITRPCLCRIEGRIRNESNTSATFNAKTAVSCVEAALQTTSLLPDQPDINFIYPRGPWWAIVHISRYSKMRSGVDTYHQRIVMQAMAILLLEMAYDSKDMANDDASIVISIKKLLRWLRTMRVNDPVAAQALVVIKKILRGCAPKLQAQVSDLLDTDGDRTPPIPRRDQDARSHHAQNQHQPQQPFANQQPPASWPQGGSFNNPTGNNMNFSTNAFQQQPYDPFVAADMYPYTLAPQDQFPMAFSSPFFTSFDQGAPVVELQDLWPSPSTGDIGAMPSNLDMPLNTQEEMLDSVMDYSPQYQPGRGEA